MDLRGGAVRLRQPAPHAEIPISCSRRTQLRVRRTRYPRSPPSSRGRAATITRGPAGSCGNASNCRLASSTYCQSSITINRTLDRQRPEKRQQVINDAAGGGALRWTAHRPTQLASASAPGMDPGSSKRRRREGGSAASARRAAAPQRRDSSRNRLQQRDPVISGCFGALPAGASSQAGSAYGDRHRCPTAGPKSRRKRVVSLRPRKGVSPRCAVASKRRVTPARRTPDAEHLQ